MSFQVYRDETLTNLNVLGKIRTLNLNAETINSDVLAVDSRGNEYTFDQTPVKTFTDNAEYPNGYEQSITQKKWAVNLAVGTRTRTGVDQKYVALGDQSVRVTIQVEVPGATPGTVKPYSILTPVAPATFDTAALTSTGTQQETWLYLPTEDFNRDTAPIKVTVISASEIRTPFPLQYEATTWSPSTGPFLAELVRVSIPQFYYSIQVGGMQLDDVDGGTCIVKTKVVGTVFTPGVLLKMAKLRADGKWIQFIPTVANGNPQMPDTFGIITYLVTNLEAGAQYCASPAFPGQDFTSLTGAGIPFDENALSNPFFLNAMRSQTSSYEVARFKMPYGSDNTKDVFFGSGSCQASPMLRQVFEGVEDLKLDFFMHLGDVIYADDANNYFSLDAADPALARQLMLNEFYDNLLRSDSYVKLLTSTGMYGALDDHEVTDNWDSRPSLNSGIYFSTNDEAAVYNSLTSGANFNINRGFLIYRYPSAPSTPQNPLPAAVVPNEVIRISYNEYDRRIISRPQSAIVADVRHYTVHWGSADLIVIDRMPKVNLATGAAVYPKSTGDYWLPEEIAYMKQELLASTALVKFVASGQGPSNWFEQFLPIVRAKYVELGVAKGYTAELALASFEKVHGYAQTNFVDLYEDQRQEIINFITTNNIKNVIFLGGGDHESYVEYLNLTTPIIQIETSAIGTYPGRNNPAVEAGLPINERVLAAETRNNYVTVKVDTIKAQVIIACRRGLNTLFEVTLKLK